MPFPTFFNLPEEKRQNILDCAVDEFARHDYDSASISRIVARAGIAKGSLYQYFQDKSDLHRYLLGLATRQKAEMMAGIRAREPGAAFFDTLRRLFHEMANFEILYPRLAKIGYRALYGKSPLPEDIVTQARLSTVQYFQDLIEQGKNQGEIRPDLDSAAAAFIFTAALSELVSYLAARAGVDPLQFIQEGSNPLQALDLNKIFEQIVSILQFGMEKQPDPEG
jgi:AcrR family transcriptional regulator